MPWTIRRYEKSDLPALADIYRQAIRHLGDAHYSAEQVAAWSGHADDAGAFETWIDRAATFVAVDGRGFCIGFGGLEDSGRIASLFVAPGAMRQGVGTGLLKRLLHELGARGLREATTEASEFSKPLFEKFGFRVREIEHTRYKGVAFSRYVMHWKQSPA